MSTPLSFCDISARYGQAPAPQQTIEEQTGWNPKQLFLDYMFKLRRQAKQDAKEAEEDALMAVIDAMTARDKEDKRPDAVTADDLGKASKAVYERHNGEVSPEKSLTLQVMLSCLGDRFTFDQVDEVQENTEKTMELEKQKAKEESLEVTEKRGLSDPRDPYNMQGGE